LAPHKNITKTLEAPKTKIEDFILQVSIFASNFHGINVNVYDWCIFGHEGEQMQVVIEWARVNKWYMGIVFKEITQACISKILRDFV
jgi:hypothetical protein